MTAIISTIILLGDLLKLRTPKIIPAMPDGIPKKKPEKNTTGPSEPNTALLIQCHRGIYQEAIATYGKTARIPNTRHPMASHNDDALTLRGLDIGMTVF